MKTRQKVEVNDLSEFQRLKFSEVTVKHVGTEQRRKRKFYHVIELKSLS